MIHHHLFEIECFSLEKDVSSLWCKNNVCFLLKCPVTGILVSFSDISAKSFNNMLMIISKWLDCVGQNHRDMKCSIFTVRFSMQDCDYNSVVLQFCTFHTCIIKAESYLSSTATAAASAGDPYSAPPSASSRLSDSSFLLLFSSSLFCHQPADDEIQASQRRCCCGC